MFDTMVLTKTVAALCAALLFFLVGKWVAEEIYMPPHGAHAAAVYPLPPEEGAEPAAAEPEEQIDVMALYAEADAAAGEGLWRNCRACHALEDGVNGTGPHLYGVVGRGIDVVPGFNYSGALEQLGDVWDVETLFAFIGDPRGTAPGTRMVYAGMRNPQDRLNLIRFLDEQDS
ncbi:MAG: c-type cytochrome [Pararhodobacter sp.]